MLLPGGAINVIAPAGTAKMHVELLLTAIAGELDDSGMSGMSCDIFSAYNIHSNRGSPSLITRSSTIPVYEYSGIAVGTTKVYLKTTSSVRLDQLRDKALVKVVLKLQAGVLELRVYVDYLLSIYF